MPRVKQFRIGNLAVSHHGLDSPVWRVKEVSRTRVGVVDACIEHQRPNQQIQWVDRSILLEPTNAQIHLPAMKRFLDLRDAQGAAEYIGSMQTSTHQTAAMDAAAYMGMQPEFYAGSIRVFIPSKQEA